MRTYPPTDDDAFEIVDGKPVLKDGKAMTVSVMLMDAAPAKPVLNRPGSVTISDDDRQRRQKMIADANKKLSERWRNPSPSSATEAVQLTQAATPTTDLAAAYSRRDKALSERWRQGGAV